MAAKTLPPWLQKAKGVNSTKKAKNPEGFVDAIKRRKAKMSAPGKTDKTDIPAKEESDNA